MTDPIRLSKRLIELTQCSRREAELYIEGGWVLVDGEVVDEPQFKVSDQRVELHPDAKAEPLEPVTLLLHVAAGTNTAALPVSLDGRWPEDASGIHPLRQHCNRLTACLELQSGACGLHVLTQDWRVQRKLTDDADRVEQEYIVEVSGDITDDKLKRLNQPFTLRGAVLPACKVSRQNETRLRFAVKNPRPGQLEYLCSHVGLDIANMKRIRIGGVSMAKVPAGQWRYLAAKERF